MPGQGQRKWGGQVGNYVIEPPDFGNHDLLIRMTFYYVGAHPDFQNVRRHFPWRKLRLVLHVYVQVINREHGVTLSHFHRIRQWIPNFILWNFWSLQNINQNESIFCYCYLQGLHNTRVKTARYHQFCGVINFNFQQTADPRHPEF